MNESIEAKKLTISVQVLIAVILSTVTICFTVISSVYAIKEDIAGAIIQIKTENQMQDLKIENLKIEVDRNKLAIEKMKEEYRRERNDRF